MNEIEEQQERKQKEMYENKNKALENAMEIENEGNQPLYCDCLKWVSCRFTFEDEAIDSAASLVKQPL